MHYKPFLAKIRSVDELLLFLAKRGAATQPVIAKTTEIGAALSMSQQNASVRLRSLEERGLVERKGRRLVLTKEGIMELRGLYSQLKSVFEEQAFTFRGKVVEGLGEGRYYVSRPGYMRQFKNRLGFRPYPGTLNLELGNGYLEKRLQLRENPPIIMDGFKSGGRSFGPIEAYRCRLGKIEGAVIFPTRSHHPLTVIEVIAQPCLRKALGLKKGSEAELEIIFR